MRALQYLIIQLAWTTCWTFGMAYSGYAAEPWESIHKEDHLEVFESTLPKKDDHFVSNAKGIIAAPYASVVKTLSDLDNYTKWVGHVAESKVIKRINTTTAVLYLLAHAPWPLSDRYYVINTKITKTPKLFTLTMTPNEDLVIEPSDNVLATLPLGKFTVTPKDPTHTYVEFYVDLIVKTFFPKWTFRMMHISWTTGFFEQLNKASQAQPIVTLPVKKR